MLDTLLHLIAPHDCIVCGREGYVICDYCSDQIAGSIPSRCFLCLRATSFSSTCDACRTRSSIRCLWACGVYAGELKNALHQYKFEGKRAAANDFVKMMSAALPYLPPKTIVVHVPTATSRVRIRGFDQAKLLARSLAVDKGLLYADVLRRTGQTRQLGLGRQDRIASTKNIYEVKNADLVRGASIVLVDDIVTTGATLSEAARVLRKAGAAHIDAVVVAQTMDG